MTATKASNRKQYVKNQVRFKAQALARYHANPAAAKARRKRWKKNAPDAAAESLRRTHLRKYNLTAEQYEAMLVAQNGVCAICQEPETASENGKVRRLAIDHDRRCCPGDGSCGKCVRMLLCGRHNMMLGHAGDSIRILLSAVDYLKRHSWP
jgi:Recombination endonuclease VII